MEGKRFKKDKSLERRHLAEKVSNEIRNEFKEREKLRKKEFLSEDISANIAQDFKAEQRRSNKIESDISKNIQLRDDSTTSQTPEKLEKSELRVSEYESSYISHDLDSKRFLEIKTDVNEQPDEKSERRHYRLDENTPVSDTHKGLSEIPRDVVQELASQIESEKWSIDELDTLIDEIQHKLPDSETVLVYTDLSESLQLSKEDLHDLQDAFEESSFSYGTISDTGEPTHDKKQDCRAALVDARLYIRARKSNGIRLEECYDSLYYYFKNEGEFQNYIAAAEDGLDTGGTSQISNKRAHLKELVTQMSSEVKNQLCISIYKPRIKGECIDIMNNLAGLNLSDLEGKISKITKYSGKGGIENPRFPEGENLEVSVARLLGIAVSDCHLKPNGTLCYAERELRRIKMVERDLQAFGDIELIPRKREDENMFDVYFPTPLGIMVENLGIPSGDRTVQNPGLPEVFETFSPKAQLAFIEELVPQDGTVSGNYIYWTHSNVLDAAEKAEIYDFKSKVGMEEIKLIKEHGTREEHSWVLYYMKLQKLRKSEPEEIGEVARKLWNAVIENPNRLVQDEVRIVRRMGIEYSRMPYTIRYYTRTKRVSVAWTAVPDGILESVKLMILAPSNDVVKREKMRDILRKHPEDLSRAKEYFTKKGIEFVEWWKE